MKKVIKYLPLVIALFLTSPGKAKAQECGNCKQTPIVACYDLDIQIPPPATGNKESEGGLEWRQLFWLAKHANGYLFKNNKDCIRFVVGPDQDANENGEQDIIKVSATSTALPHDKYNMGYLTTGYVKQTGDTYLMHIELQLSCTRKTVAFADIPFKLTADSRYIENIAQQAAAKLSPLAEKIKQFELKEREGNRKFFLGGEHNLIRITPAKKGLTAGQETDLQIEVKDCDDQPLAGREIVFKQGLVNDTKITGTLGGIVTPATLITDAQGKAKAKFKMTATAQPAIINAHSLGSNARNCTDAFIGSIKVDALPAYKVTVDYFKEGREDFNMNSIEDGVSLSASEQKNWQVAYSISLFHYPAVRKKDGDQLMIVPEFENQMPGGGKTIVTANNGYSEFSIGENPIALGTANEKKTSRNQRVFSNTPQLPSVSFIIKDHQLIFFSCTLDFPEQESELSPVAGSFGIEKDNQEFFPVKGQMINDPNSAFKWEYTIEYKEKEGYDQEREIFSAGKKEKTRASIKILSLY